MIDADGFRANVGIIVCDQAGKLLWTRRYGQTSWQFPQGGVNPGESPEATLYRELYEEIGLQREDVKILGSTREWLKYRLPARLVRQDSAPLCIGQKQKWFLLRLISKEDRIRFDTSEHPEFDDLLWVNYWYPVRQVVAFKREVYREALQELLPCLMRSQLQNPQRSRKRRSGQERSRQRDNPSGKR